MGTWGLIVVEEHTISKIQNSIYQNGRYATVNSRQNASGATAVVWLIANVMYLW